MRFFPVAFRGLPTQPESTNPKLRDMIPALGL